MAVKKISVALDPVVAEAAATAAAESGRSLSAWLNDAARQHLRLERGRRAGAEWQEEHGALSADERASAEATIDALLGSAPGHG